MKLNLGCGSNHFADAVNVDFKDPCDVQADLTKPLPFDDNSADTIGTFHFIEHIRRYQLNGFLRECYRILKPGGQFIVEAPCLDELFDLVKEDVHENWTYIMARLYGNTEEGKEPFQHYWCYSVSELAREMHIAGFNDIRQAETKTHYPGRDMRLEATK